MKLDTEVERVRSLLRASASNQWHAGKALLKIHDEELWRERFEGGTPCFKTWKAFCRLELKLSAAHVYRMMDVARYFTQAQVHKYGFTKLALIARTPTDEHPRLLAIAAGGSVRPVERAVRLIVNGSSRHQKLDADDLLNQLHSWLDAASAFPSLDALRSDVSRTLNRYARSKAA